MFHCPLCQHAAHARTSRYITDTTKERYHQCQNVNCSATFITYESVPQDLELNYALLMRNFSGETTRNPHGK